MVSKCSVLAVLVLSLGLSAVTHAQDYRYTLSLALGDHDVDTENSEDPHFNELSYNVLVGYNWSKYLVVEAEAFHVPSASGIDVFDERFSFGGDAVGLSLRLQWPLADDFSAYLRLGGAAYKLSDAEIANEPVDETWTQPLYGGGVRGKHWFVEYVNYGEVEDFYLEQLRGGIVIRF